MSPTAPRYSLFLSLVDRPCAVGDLGERLREVADAILAEPMVPAEIKDLVRVWRQITATGYGIRVIDALASVRDGIARPLQAAVRFILACQNSPEDARAVAVILLNQALRAEGMSERERRRRMRQAIGWLGVCAGAFYENELCSVPATAALASFDIGHRLEELLVSEPSDRIAERMLGRIKDIRSEKGEIPNLTSTGHSRRLVDRDAVEFHLNAPENPMVHIGVLAKLIVSRLPQVKEAAATLIEAPTDFSKGWNLVFALRALELEDYDTREEVEATVLALAYAGDRSAAMQAATYAIGRTYNKPSGHMVERALGWLAVASGARPMPADVAYHDELDDVLEVAGQHLSDSVRPAAPAAPVARAPSPLSKLRQDQKKTADETEKEFGSLFEVNVSLIVEGEEAQDLPDMIDDTAAVREPYAIKPVSQIGKLRERESEDTRAVLGCLLRPLPLKRIPRDLEAWRTSLLAEFPHASAAINAWYGDLSARQLSGKGAFHLRPTLLVGPPGTGKTRLARRMAMAASIPFVPHTAAAVSDGMFAGLSRGFSSSHPSAPLCAMRDKGVANPVLLLDEVEKAATSRHNGSLWDAVLTMLEPETSSRWPDAFVQAPVNLSWVNWVMTANSLGALPAPLKDRVRVIAVPAPEVGHVPALASSVLADLAAQSGHQGWLPPLDGEELSVLVEQWPRHKSMRVLQRMVEALLAERDRAAARN